MLAIEAVLFFLWGRIFHKAGFSWLLALLMFLPFVNAIVIVWFGFTKWPIEKEIERIRQTAIPVRGNP
jgi:hypothetical protein